jgi:hypothetical protein
LAYAIDLSWSAQVLGVRLHCPVIGRRAVSEGERWKCRSFEHVVKAGQMKGEPSP